MKFDCVEELNPLLPSRPKIYQMVTLKASILGPTIGFLHNNKLLTDKGLLPATLITGSVVVNNFEVLKRAEKRCNKI